MSDRDKNGCLPMQVVLPSADAPWYRRWHRTLDELPRALSTRQQEALARILPMLWCGEQSAITVFHNEAQRLSKEARQQSLAHFRAIAAEETLHERALRELSERLPAPADLHAIKRRAQHYFLRIGRTRTVAERFGQIAQLDRAVCVLLHSLERSTIGTTDCTGPLIRQIKRDEARHVSISRHHSVALGLDRSAYDELGLSVREGLAELLHPTGDAFDELGADLDELLVRVRRA